MAAPIKIIVNDELRATLESWTRRGKTERRLAKRARIILLIAAGEERTAIAESLDITPGIVSKWRRRFIGYGTDGLFDMPRSGKPRVYDEITERQVLSVLDKQPPSGFSRWNGPLIAAALGDITGHQVWRIFRKTASPWSEGVPSVFRQILNSAPKRLILSDCIFLRRKGPW